MTGVEDNLLIKNNMKYKKFKKLIFEKWWFWILIIFAILIVIIISLSDNKKTETQSQSNTSSVSSINKTNIKKQNIDLSTVDYEIIEAEDISFIEAGINVIRYRIKVVINNNPATKQQVSAISEKIVADYDDVDAVSIAYYFDKTQVDGVYTLAMVEWAPNGDWSQANLKENQKLTYQFTNLIDKKRTNEPTALEREINQAMGDKWYELSENSQLPVTDEYVAEILAPQYNKTVEEMLEIREKVTFYDWGL